MPSQTIENYLKALFFLSTENAEVSLTKLAEKMNVSVPTTNSMIKNLEGRGLVAYKKYKPVRLTKKGKKEAALVIRKHRLTEMFLSEIMGFGWEEVHDIAEEMEHLNTNQLFDRMDKMLNYPTVDPHGSPIPNAKGEFIIKERYGLSEIGIGKTVLLTGIEKSSKPFLTYLTKKNIELGTAIKVISKESYDKSMVIQYNQELETTISYEVSSNLLVEFIDK